MTEVVAAKDALLRRVADHPDLWNRTDDGAVRPSSVAMKPHPDDLQLSVDVRRLIADPTNPTSVLNDLPGYGLVELLAEIARALSLDVIHEPLPDNPAHANITGFDVLSKSNSKRVQRELAKAAVWIQMPAGALAES